MSLVSTDANHVIGLIEEGLIAIHDATGAKFDLEHIMSQLNEKSGAFLFVDSDLTGYVILRASYDFLIDAVRLYVLIAYKTGGVGMDTYQKDIEEIAKSIGAKLITFKTKRKSLARKALRFGYEESGYIELTKEVGYE